MIFINDVFDNRLMKFNKLEDSDSAICLFWIKINELELNFAEPLKHTYWTIKFCNWIERVKIFQYITKLLYFNWLASLFNNHNHSKHNIYQTPPKNINIAINWRCYMQSWWGYIVVEDWCKRRRGIRV